MQNITVQMDVSATIPAMPRFHSDSWEAQSHSLS